MHPGEASTIIMVLCGVVQTQGTRCGNREPCGTCPQFSLTSPPIGTYSCPGSNMTYTCVLSSSAAGVITVWSGSAFQCPPTNQIVLLQRSAGTLETFTPMSCGRLFAVTTNVTSTCYTSVLTIPAVQALDGTTVVCADVPASPGPVGNTTVKSTSVDQLTVTWTPPTTGGVPTSYNVTINDSSSPVVIADNGSPVYTHTFTGLVSDTLYTVSVVAINCAGASSTVAASGRTVAHPPVSVQVVSVFNPNNTLHHLEISWIPLGGSVSVYTVRVVGTGGTSVGQGSTKCTTSPCLYTQQVSVFASSYTIIVASINGAGDEDPYSTITINSSINYVIQKTSFLSYFDSVAMMDCSFFYCQSFYCEVCCSTDTSVPPDSSVYNISTTRGTEVTVSLQGLTSGQMYYCKAAATNTNSNNCAGPVVGGVKLLFSFMAYPSSTSNVSNAASLVPSIDVSTAVGITFSITFIMALSLGVLMTVCIFKTRSKTTSPHHYTPNAPNEVVGINQKIDVIPLDSNVAYGRVK
eukprot:Em0006g516a